MKISIVGESLPLKDGSAPGKALYALAEGLLGEGHEVDVTTWWTEGPADDLPAWCTWRPLAQESTLHSRVRALLSPRSDSTRFEWHPKEGGIAVADGVSSFAAVARSPRSVATFHYLTRFDASVRRSAPSDIQTVRAERRARRRAGLVTAYSSRVARALGPRAVEVPIAYPVPSNPVPFVAAPVAGMIADWRWPPNRAALVILRAAWPEVAARVPGARLILAGTASDRLGIESADGVEVIGPVARVEDFWSQVGVLVFPCPPSSGPKIKVIESLSYGVPVVTTQEGIEGIQLPAGDGAVVSSETRFATDVATLLGDEEKRASLGRSGRAAILSGHAPSPAARLRVRAFEEAFGLQS